MVANERLELPNQLGMRSKVDFGSDPLFERDKAQFFEVVDRGFRKRFVREICEWWATPKGERVAQHSRAILRIAASRLGDESFEPKGVEFGISHLQDVAGRLSDNDLRAQQLSQLRDLVLERRHGRPRRLLTPELVDEPVSRDGFPGMDEQYGEQRALLSPPKRQCLAVTLDHEWAKDAELQHGLLFLTRSKPLA
jgi:hypothetical protein